MDNGLKRMNKESESYIIDFKTALEIFKNSETDESDSPDVFIDGITMLGYGVEIQFTVIRYGNEFSNIENHKTIWLIASTNFDINVFVYGFLMGNIQRARHGRRCHENPAKIVILRTIMGDVYNEIIRYHNNEISRYHDYKFITYSNKTNIVDDVTFSNLINDCTDIKICRIDINYEFNYIQLDWVFADGHTVCTYTTKWRYSILTDEINENILTYLSKDNNYIRLDYIQFVHEYCFHSVHKNASSFAFLESLVEEISNLVFNKNIMTPPTSDIPKKKDDDSCKDEKDMVSHPSHYTNGTIEVKDYIHEQIGDEGYIDYCRGNVIKYFSRANFKWNKREDLLKGAFYANEIKNVLNDNDELFR